MYTFQLTNSCLLVLSLGDLTKWRGDAIVNAANEIMLGGGGVDGAIHRAAGPELRKYCQTVPEVSPNVRCPTGSARLTPGFQLPAKYVIHTVGPVYKSESISAPLLQSAYQSSLQLAVEKNLESIAFPAISCGVFKYPLRDAAKIAIETCRDQSAPPLSRIEFVLFNNDILQTWVQVAKAILPSTQDEL